MRSNTLAGLVVLAFVVAGVLWARGYRSASPEGLALRREGPAPQQDAPVGGLESRSSWLRRSSETRLSEARSSEPPAFRPGAPSADAALPDVTLAEAVADLGDIRVTLSVTPRPPVAFQKKRFRVRVDSNGTPMVLEDGRISFEMTMPMGDHRYSLVPGADGWYEALVVLPFCQSGNRRWYAMVEGTVRGRPVTARFRLDLAKPGTTPSH